MSKIVQSLSAKLPILQEAIIREGKPKWNLFMKYAKVELAPPGPGDIPEIARGVQGLIGGFFKGRWTKVTVKEAWLNTMITVEVACWFFVGECIGKLHFVGYKV